MNKKKKLEEGELGVCVHSQHEGDNDKDKLFFPPTRKMKIKTKTRKVPQELEKITKRAKGLVGNFALTCNMNMITMIKMNDSTHLQDKHHGK